MTAWPRATPAIPAIPACPSTAMCLAGKANHGPNLYAPNYKDFAPRFAFAYVPVFLRKTVITGGAGIIYDRTMINTINFLEDQVLELYSPAHVFNEFGSNAGAGASLAADPRVGSSLAYSPSLNPTAPVVTTPYTPYVDSTGHALWIGGRPNQLRHRPQSQGSLLNRLQRRNPAGAARPHDSETELCWQARTPSQRGCGREPGHRRSRLHRRLYTVDGGRLCWPHHGTQGGQGLTESRHNRGSRMSCRPVEPPSASTTHPESSNTMAQ